MHLDELKVNASGENEADEYDKENIADFVLWKAYDRARDGEIFWESPFGRGRPGWHIECSAMAMKLLGETIDIHCGGVDNIFPHHENEIAQSECFSGNLFVRHWVHVEHLIVDHRKMSKSLGNFYTLRDLLQKDYTGRQIRYLLLSTHYRTQLNFTMQGLDAAAAVALQARRPRPAPAKGPYQKRVGRRAERASFCCRWGFREALKRYQYFSGAGRPFRFDPRFKYFCRCGRSLENRCAARFGVIAKMGYRALRFAALRGSVPPEIAALLEQREAARREKNYKRATGCGRKFKSADIAWKTPRQAPGSKRSIDI